ncbi:RagB/SusD family nutrient uptake outer membrane protein [Pedobacter mendelii]|uniref:Membrane protein n=1 Tax=Pedobacter mendelii TaxID=1908240 RepID=A0ABQ2BGI4_9SPHI|nr:RagB/SusD family nutrient uptake outer membrane protein [Pedobacter mendelii]GGI23673.1 membrane protein [Pedobacter mendelii]
MKQKLIIISILVVGITTILSCKKFVDVDPPKTEILTSEAFLQDKSATSAVLGIYANMVNDNNFINSGITIYSGVAADEFASAQDPEGLQFEKNQILPTSSIINSMWTGAYRNLAQINTCITGLEASNTLTPAVKAQLLGEAKFSRAYTNFYLVNLFGNVPLVTGLDYKQNAIIAQSNSTDVHKAIIADLLDAQSQLSNTYPTSGKVRPNKLAATALLARAYLYVNDYANAEIQASAVISSGTYGPLPTLTNTFLRGSIETIWQLLPLSNYSATQEGYIFLRQATTGGGYYFTSDLLNSFETGDNRKTAWIGTATASGVTYNYPFKYKDVGQYLPATVTENYIMLRLSEQYLIRAEARAQQGNLTNALSDINVIRSRAGLPNFNTTDKVTLLTAIANENRHEFFAEWGHRWLDLKRTGTVNAVLSAKKPTWKASAALFPIPQSEIIVNKSLVQNPGY